MSNIFMVDIDGTQLLPEETVLLQHPQVGAVLLFSRNFLNPTQLGQLIAEIRAIRSDIFIAADHEGGVVQRFQRHGIIPLPALHVYGKVYDYNPEVGQQLARDYGEIMAQDLLNLGVDLSLAPVIDVDSGCPILGRLHRTFHADPDVIIALATAFIQGMLAAGMPAVGKHFPGHGAVMSDSHLEMPYCDVPEHTLRTRDLKPFAALIQHHLLAGIMPAHVTYAAKDPHHPAGFSTIWLQTILRHEMGFQGLIISDCLGMRGADIGDLSTRSERALEAGCDMLILSNQPRPVLLEVLDTVFDKQSGESLQRINAFKQSMRRFSGSHDATPHIAYHSDKNTMQSITNQADSSPNAYSNPNASLNRTTEV